MNIVTQGLVFAGTKSGNVHNEVLRTRIEGGRMVADISQYGATLANMEHGREFTMYASEIIYSLKKGLAHIIKGGTP